MRGSLRDQDQLLTIPGLEFGSGVIGVCDICGKRQAVIVLQKERYKLCVIDFLNKTWVGSKTAPGAPLPPYRSERVWFPTDTSPTGTAPAIVLSPTKPVRRPVVLITPDVYGITTSVAEAAIRFAREGFEVLVPDLARTPGIGAGHHLSLRWGARARGGVDSRSPKVLQLTRLYSDALAYLRGRDMVDPEKAAVFGSSYGGSLAVTVAGQDPRLTALILAYPVAVQPAEFVRVISSPVLFIGGGKDPYVARSRATFQATTGERPLDVEFVDYPEASHQFLSRDLKPYRMNEAEDAWNRMAAFLRQRMLPPPPKPPTPPKSMTPAAPPAAPTPPAATTPAPSSSPTSTAPVTPRPTA